MRQPTTNSSLSPLARKGGVIVLGGLVGLLLLAGLPFLWLGGLGEQVLADKAQYDLLAARAARLSDAGRVRLTEADQPARLFLPGETAGTTLAAFQSIVNAAAVKSGLGIMRMQPLPADTVNGLSAYRLSVDAAGGIEQLRSFLADIESSLPLIVVSGFEIRPQNSATPGEQPYPSEALALSLRLEAYGLGGAE